MICNGVSNDPYMLLDKCGYPQFISPGYDPIAEIPTPREIVPRPALRGGVSRRGEAFDPAPLTCMVFDPMVQADFWHMKFVC